MRKAGPAARRAGRGALSGHRAGTTGARTRGVLQVPNGSRRRGTAGTQGFCGPGASPRRVRVEGPGGWTVRDVRGKGRRGLDHQDPAAPRACSHFSWTSICRVPRPACPVPGGRVLGSHPSTWKCRRTRFSPAREEAGGGKPAQVTIRAGSRGASAAPGQPGVPGRAGAGPLERSRAETSPREAFWNPGRREGTKQTDRQADRQTLTHPLGASPRAKEEELLVQGPSPLAPRKPVPAWISGVSGG